MTRPDMSSYFRSRIDNRVNGMFAPVARVPRDVKKVSGDVTSSVITVTMVDGTEYRWSGGRYAARKRNGCYAPLMPKPID